MEPPHRLVLFLAWHSSMYKQYVYIDIFALATLEPRVGCAFISNCAESGNL